MSTEEELREAAAMDRAAVLEAKEFCGVSAADRRLAELKRGEDGGTWYAFPWERHESEPCERGTVGCSVIHPWNVETLCEVW